MINDCGAVSHVFTVQPGVLPGFAVHEDINFEHYSSPTNLDPAFSQFLSKQLVPFQKHFYPD